MIGPAILQPIAGVQVGSQHQNERQNERQSIEKIFQIFKGTNNLVFILLEDYGKEATSQTRQLISDCEFLADLVIELGKEIRSNYEINYINITKNG